VLGISSEEAQRMFLFLALRDMISAAKRLALVGPNASVRLQSQLQLELEVLFERYRDRPETDSHQTFPLADVMQSCQGLLPRKLFLS
jgi:urease accessory protein UreF